LFLLENAFCNKKILTFTHFFRFLNPFHFGNHFDFAKLQLSHYNKILSAWSLFSTTLALDRKIA